MSWRRVGRVGRVRIDYNSDDKEYRVREPARPGGGIASGPSDGYFTSDKKDAYDTAKNMAERSESYYRRNSHKRRKRPVISGRRSDFRVSLWQERDRIHVSLKKLEPRVAGGGFQMELEVADWWDDDARQMFEDGFFTAGNLERSVVDYAIDAGIIEVSG